MHRHCLRLLALSPFLFPLTAALLFLCGPVRACIWDSDTLAQEARAFPDLVQVITGRFPRNPPLYYTMRLDRARRQIAADANDLAAYDDAGAACDRLGRDDEAIAWMEKKRARLALMSKTDPAVREHWYRYHANVGTFWAHRWLLQGADRTRLDDMRTARNHIRKAIAINPDAHFGREKYQLQVMDWILDPTRSELKGHAVYGNKPVPLSWHISTTDADRDAAAAIKGMAGLIVLGNAWESVDVFEALVHLLERRGDYALAYLAKRRVAELIGQGRRSLRPGAPEGEALAAELRLATTSSRKKREIEERYSVLRAEAERWQKRRTDYLTDRLLRGRHPDTDPAFWNEFRNTPSPSLRGSWLQEWTAQWRSPSGQFFWTVLALFFWTTVGLIVVVRIVRWRRHGKKREGM